MTVHRICEDGQTLEIVRVVPEGTLRTIVRWDHPPTDEEVTTALRANSALEIALLTEQLGDGETKVRSRRQLTKRGAWYLTVQSGPPIWRYPRVDFLRWWDITRFHRGWRMPNYDALRKVPRQLA